MIDIEIPEKKIKRYLPERWEELTTVQYLKICGWLYDLSKKKLTVDTFYLLMMYDFLGVKKTTKKIKLEICESFAKIQEAIKYIFTFDEKTGYYLNLDFTKNLLPSFAYNFKIYYGPADSLGDISFYEFLTAHSAYYMYHLTKDELHLTQLAATLYRPIDKVTGKKEVFNQDTLNERQLLFNNLHIYIKYSVFLYFEAMMQYLKVHEKYKNIFKASATESDKEEGVGLASVIYTFNERNLTNNLDYLYNTLDILYLDYLKMKDLKQNLKK